MRRLLFTAGVLLSAASLSPATFADTTATFHVVYNSKDMGTWKTLVLGKKKDGSYDGDAFDYSNGPGFLTVALSRPLSAADRSSLFSSLPPANGELVVTASQSGKPDAVTTCPKTTVSDFNSSGDPGTGTETITFACTAIVALKS
jgi:hypothetical protein